MNGEVHLQYLGWHLEKR